MSTLDARSARRNDLQPNRLHPSVFTEIEIRLQSSTLSPTATKAALRSLKKVASSGLTTKAISTAAGVSRASVSNYRWGSWSKLAKHDREQIEVTLAELKVPGFVTANEMTARRRERFRQQYLDYHRRGQRCPPAND